MSRATVEGPIVEGGGAISGRVNGVRLTVGASRGLAAEAPEAPLDASVAWFAEQGVGRGYFVLVDTLRDGVGAVLRALWQRSVPCRILSGDRREATRALAHRLGVPGAGGLSPVDKALIVRDLQHGGARVLFVGSGVDGVSPCAHADVAVSISSALSQAADPAPIVLTEQRLDGLPWLIDAARALRRATWWAGAVGVVFNVALIPAAVLGWLHPITAALLVLIEGLLAFTFAAQLIRRPAPGGPRGPR